MKRIIVNQLMKKSSKKKTSKSNQATTTETMSATAAMVPETVKVGWNTVSLSFVDPSFIKESDCFGQYLSRECKIEIQKELSGDQLINTILHEIIHCIIYNSSLNQDGGPLTDDKSEEQVTNSITNWLLNVFWDNPWLIELLKKRSS
jgi:hypothetical protein